MCSVPFLTPIVTLWNLIGTKLLVPCPQATNADGYLLLLSPGERHLPKKLKMSSLFVRSVRYPVCFKWTLCNWVIILQVRGILNKLTPEKFRKLTDDLLNTDLNSSKILKGVILLVSKTFKLFHCTFILVLRNSYFYYCQFIDRITKCSRVHRKLSNESIKNSMPVNLLCAMYKQGQVAHMMK